MPTLGVRVLFSPTIFPLENDVDNIKPATGKRIPNRTKRCQASHPHQVINHSNASSHRSRTPGIDNGCPKSLLQCVHVWSVISGELQHAQAHLDTELLPPVLQPLPRESLQRRHVHRLPSRRTAKMRTKNIALKTRSFVRVLKTFPAHPFIFQREHVSLCGE